MGGVMIRGLRDHQVEAIIDVELVTLMQIHPSMNRGSHPTFLEKTLISTLHTFILGSQNSDIGPTAKSHILLIIPNPPSNPMALIRSLCAMWLPLYMRIPYLILIRTWGGTLLSRPHFPLYELCGT